MAVPPISGGVPPMNLGGLEGLGSGLGAGQGTSATPGFADALQQGLQAVSDLEHNADAAIQDVATGGETSIHELMTATTKAQIGVEMLTTVRDRAVEAYQEIMRMQV